MQQYLDLLRKIRQDGIVKSDRTGTGTRSIFGYQMRFDLEVGFPLLTTKKVFLKGVIYELLWFLQGDTNIKYLLDHGVHIWDNDAYRYYNELCVRHGVLPLEREAFLDAVRREEPSSIDGYRPGDLNHVYGYQWRSWPRPDGGCIDQIRQVIDQIKHSPDSRRMLVSAWNVAEVDDMALPPCHVLFQFYVAGGRLSCQLYQRSADTFLGVPFNIASYAVLTMMIAQECGLRPGDFVHTLGDAHLYLNHADQVAEQLSRTPRPLPTLRLNPAVRSVFDFRYEDFTLENYLAGDQGSDVVLAMRVILYMLSAAVLILSASCSHADRGGKVETEVPRTSMDPEGLGGWQVLVYEGILPEASGDGKTCVKLTIESREHSGDGTFTLERFYSEADACRREVSVRRGRRYTLRGIPENADATVWQLVTEEGNETINLLKGGDDTLTLLDAKQRILPSVSGFELILKEKTID